MGGGAQEETASFAERKHVFEGTRLAPRRPRRHCVLPPASSPAPEHLPRRKGVSRLASATQYLADPLLTHTLPTASLTGPSTSLCCSGSASHLGSMEASSLSSSAVSAQEKQGLRSHRASLLEQQYPVVSKTDFFLPPHLIKRLFFEITFWTILLTLIILFP